MRKLLRAVFGLGGAQVIGLLLGMVATKIMAIVIGASGLGFYSLLRQVSDSIIGFAALGSGSGLIQGLVTRENETRSRLLSTGFWLCVAGAVIAASVLVLAGDGLAVAVFGDGQESNATAIRWLALAVIVGILTSFVTSLVQTNGRFKAFSFGQIFSSAVLAALAYPVALAAIDQRAALVAMIVVPAVVQIAWAIWPLHNSGELERLRNAVALTPDRASLHHFGRFIVLGLAMMVIGTLAGTVVRALIVQHYGLEAAGHFQAAWTLGMQNLTLLLTPFATYVYPTLAGTQDLAARRVAWLDISTVIVGGALPMVVGAIVFKPLFLRIFYTAEFLPAIAVLQWMLLANYPKAISWLFAVSISSAGDLRLYFFGEAVWNIGFTALVFAAVFFGLPVEFVGIAFVAAYAVFLPLVMTICWLKYRLVFDRRLMVVATVGMALVVGSAAGTWNQVTVNWPLAIVASMAAGVVGYFALTPRRRDVIRRAILPNPQQG